MKRSILIASMLAAALGGTAAKAGTHIEIGGIVVVEAENFDSRTDATDDTENVHKWVRIPDEAAGTPTQFAHARGGKYIQVQPDVGQNRNNADAKDAGPMAIYKLEIKTPGLYRLHLRATGFDGSSDSMYVSIAEQSDGDGGVADWYRQAPGPTDSDFATRYNNSGWDWRGDAEQVNGNAGGVPMTWNLAAGTYTVRLHQREDAIAVDSFVLQLDSMPVPAQDVEESPLKGTSYLYLAQQPKDSNSGLNGTATLNVVAGSSATIDYQWQKAAPGSSNFTDISGAKGASYTTGALGNSDSGSQYRCVLAGGGKTTTSKAATVTVDTTPPAIALVRGSSTFDKVTVEFSEPIAPASAVAANFTIAGLAVNGVSLSGDGRVATLTTAKQGVGSDYSLTVRDVKDLVTPANTINPNPTVVSFKANVLGSGAAFFEAYAGVAGNTIPDPLDSSTVPGYPSDPGFSGILSSFDSRGLYPDDSHETYLGRIRAYLVPEQTGNYRFFTSSDDASRVFINLNGDSFDEANLTQIAEETGCCNGFTEPDSPRTSDLIPLTQGKVYALMLLYKEGGGGDFGRVAWRKEGDATPAGSLTAIPGKFLKWFISPQAILVITQQPSNATSEANKPVAFSVRYSAKSDLGTAASVQWQRAAAGINNFVDIDGATDTDYTIAFASPTDNGAKFRAVLKVSSLVTVTSDAVTLSVSTESIPPTITSVSGSLSRVNVAFNEPLDAASAVDKANYSIGDGVTVSGAQVISGANAAGIVALTVSGTQAGKVYTLTVNNVKDRSGNAIRSNTKKQFFLHNAYYDFNTGTLPADTAVTGSARVEGSGGPDGSGSLLITLPSGGLQGTFITPDLLGGAQVDKLTLRFKIFVGQGSGNPADGYSVSIADSLNESTNFGEEGVGQGLIVAFDTYDNGGGEAPAMDLKWAGQEVSTTKFPKARLVNNRWVDVAIQLSQGGKVTVIHDGETVYNGVPLPDYTPMSAVRFAIGGRTGGEFERHQVDDIAILLNADEPVIAVAKVKLHSSSDVAGPYTEEAGATIDEGARTISLPVASSGNRFFRVEGSTSIKSVQSQGGTLVVTYE